MAVSHMLTNHTRRTPNGLSLIRMAGKHLEESQRLYYLSVDWLNLNMHVHGPPRNQGADYLGDSEESDPEERIWDSTVNMYVASDTDEEEGLQESEAEIPGEGLSDLGSIDKQGDEGSGCIAGSRGHLEEECSEEEALSETTDSLPVICATAEETRQELILRFEFHPGSVPELGGKEKKRSRFHQVNLRVRSL